MQRQLTLRQIEGFKAVIECGTISNAAVMLNISQPAMSKLMAHLEEDTGLKLFDRLKGRLAPTDRGMRLYHEIDSIFAGVRQVENAVEAIRREEQGQLTVGVIPALSGAFIQRATMSFLKQKPNVFCSIQSRSSERIVDWLVARKLDIAIVSGSFENPYVIVDSIFEEPLVCIMPKGHKLANKKQVRPRDLDGLALIAFNSDSYGGQCVAAMLDENKVKANVVLVANTAPTACEFVAAGLGVALLHPLMASGFEGRIAIRRFAPSIPFDFRVCRSRDSRNAQLVQTYLHEMRETGKQISRAMLLAR